MPPFQQRLTTPHVHGSHLKATLVRVQAVGYAYHGCRCAPVPVHEPRRRGGSPGGRGALRSESVGSSARSDKTDQITDILCLTFPCRRLVSPYLNRTRRPTRPPWPCELLHTTAHRPSGGACSSWWYQLRQLCTVTSGRSTTTTGHPQRSSPRRSSGAMRPFGWDHERAGASYRARVSRQTYIDLLPTARSQVRTHQAALDGREGMSCPG